ncbi:MAG TPA: ABC transporter permease [Rugosimonospora sp.]|nr:ABC transporter permease [Rugosimonospora sp.]
MSQTLLFAGRNVRRFFRSRPNLVSVLLFPLLLMLMQLALAGKIVTAAAHGAYVDRLAPDIILVTAAFGTTVTALAMLNDIRSGLLDRVRTLPVSAFSVLGGRVVGDVARVLLVALIATGVAYLPGFRFTQGALAVLGFYGVVALFATMVTALGVLAGLSFKGMDTIRAVVGNPVLLLFLFSSGFVPVAEFPDFLQPFVRANPISIAATALYGLSHGGPVALPLLETLAWTLGVSACCVPLAIRRYRRLVR